MSKGSDNTTDKPVEQCSTKSELKRIINRCHGNADHLSDVLNPIINCSYCCYRESCYCYRCISNNEYYVKKYGMANKGVEEWQTKLAKIKQFFYLLLSEVVLSEVLVIWLMWFLLTH